MIKMDLYFDEVKVDSCYANSMKEAFEMMDSLAGFYDQNEACIDYWFKDLKRFSEPQSVRLHFDLSNYQTKCWVLFNEITQFYGYDYDIIDNTVVFDGNFSGTIGVKILGYNDITNGHFECSSIEEALIEWLETLEETNKIDKEYGNSPTWHSNAIEFIKSLIKTRKTILVEDIEQLNDNLRAKRYSFKFEIVKNPIEKPDISKSIRIVPASSTFIDSSIINITDDCYEYLKKFFYLRGITLAHNNTRTIFWAI